MTEPTAADWVSAVSNVFAAIGTVGAVIVALFREELRDWLSPVGASINLRDPAGELTYVNSGQEPMYLFHLRVRNLSRRRLLRSCRIVITEVSTETAEGGWQTRTLAVPLPLHWAPAELQPLEIDLPAGQEAIADFAWFRRLGTVNAVVFEPVLASNPANFPGRILSGAARYHVELRAQELADPVRVTIEAKSEGTWSESLQALPSVLTVRRIAPAT